MVLFGVQRAGVVGGWFNVPVGAGSARPRLNCPRCPAKPHPAVLLAFVVNPGGGSIGSSGKGRGVVGCGGVMGACRVVRRGSRSAMFGVAGLWFFLGAIWFVNGAVFGVF